MEENNGWITINNEEDIKSLPDTYCSYHGASNSFIYDTVFTRRALLLKYLDGELTHYQPIIKPKLPPIF